MICAGGSVDIESMCCSSLVTKTVFPALEGPATMHENGCLSNCSLCAMFATMMYWVFVMCFYTNDFNFYQFANSLHYKTANT